MTPKEKNRLVQHYFHINRIKVEAIRDERETRTALTEALEDGEAYTTGELIAQRMGGHISVSRVTR